MNCDAITPRLPTKIELFSRKFLKYFLTQDILFFVKYVFRKIIEPVDNLLFFYCIISFPVMCGLSNISWIFYALKLYKTAIVISLSPVLSLLVIIIMFFALL